MRLEFHPEAEEVLEAVSFYESLLPGLGERFDSEVRTAMHLLEYPEIGPPLVHIVAVAHERRKPGYWQQRL